MFFIAITFIVASPSLLAQYITVPADNEIFFTDNGQIRCLDNNHRILFRRSENILELREFGRIVFSPGATGGAETSKMVILDNGNVGIGTTNPQALTICLLVILQVIPDSSFKEEYFKDIFYHIAR